MSQYYGAWFLQNSDAITWCFDISSDQVYSYNLDIKEKIEQQYC